ncbi:ficolin-1-like [Cochliomyia hominivorax]
MYRYCKITKETIRPIFDIRYDSLPEECQEKLSDEPFLVWCDVVTHGGDWTVIQRRHDGSVDFERVWCDYANGFGDVAGEFFIGLDKLHAMTNYNGPQELLVILRDHNETKYAKYDNFVVGSKHELYTLSHVGSYSGNAGDSLLNHLKQKLKYQNIIVLNFIKELGGIRMVTKVI